MSILGGSRGAAESAAGGLLSGVFNWRPVRPNIPPAFYRNAAYYGTAVLAVTVAVVLDQINTSNARNAAAAAEAANAEIVAEQLAAEASVLADIESGSPVTIATGIRGSGELCVLNAIVEGPWLVLVAREQQDDPESLQAFVVGTVDGVSGGVNLETTTVDWDSVGGTYVVGSPDSLYAGIAVGVGLPATETDC